MFQLAWRRPRPAPRPGTHLTVTPFEERCVPAAGGTAGAPVGPVHTVVYTESNDPRPGENAVLAFRRTPTGGLARIGRFETGGTGQLNIPKVIGPDDGDQQVMATPDGRFLFAVNQGSDSVTAFRIRPDGTLARIGVFASGGDQPVSIGIAGTRLYVANRGNAAQGQPATTVSDITAFDIGPDGTLTPVAGSTITYPLGTFATQALVAPGGMLVFVNLGSLEGTADGNTVAPYQVLPDGRLALAPGGPVGASAAPTFQLGLAAHPTEPIVYAGLTADGRVAVYTYDSAGQTTFVGSSPDAGRAPCWCAVSADGGTLYVANTANDAIGVYSLADPLRPAQVQEFDLRGPRFADGDTAPDANVFEIGLDPSGGRLYAVTQSAKPTFPQGNQFHTLSVGADGLLSEPRDPIVFRQSDVPAIAHPQGVEAVGGRVDVAPPAAAGRLAGRSLVAPPPALTSAKSGGEAAAGRVTAPAPPASGPAPAADLLAVIGTGFNLGTGTTGSVDGLPSASPAPGDLTVGL
jgi:DNA-binding beta-propeller fold protein YncE